MANEALKFDVAALLTAPTGTRELYSFKGPVVFEDIKTSSEIEGKIEIMRLDDGVNAKVTGVTIKMAFKCTKCLKNFVQEILITMAERQFLLDKPAIIDDPSDLFLIDRKNLDIDLTEVLRQEIILHFPLVPVCSKSCLGICPICGKGRNQAKCGCKDQQTLQENKPLSDLKKLYYG